MTTSDGRSPGAIGLIVACDPGGLIGHEGLIPWHYRADLQRFKRLTLGCVLIMGRKTFESLPVQLKHRRVIVLTRRSRLKSRFLPDGLALDLTQAIEMALEIGRPIWIAGGGQVYMQALRQGIVDFIDMTVVPRVEQPPSGEDVFFPLSEMAGFQMEQRLRNADDPRLEHQLYVRKS